MFWDKFKREPVPFQVRFEPTIEITAFQLAFIVSKTMCQPVSFTPDAWAALPDELRKHFK